MLIFIITLVILFILGLAIYFAPSIPAGKETWFWKWCIKMRGKCIKILAKAVIRRYNCIIRKFLTYVNYSRKSKARQSWMNRQIARIYQFKAAFPDSYRELNRDNCVIADVLQANFKDLNALGIFDFWYVWWDKDKQYHLIIILSRPGLLIGRRGTTIDKIKDEITARMRASWTIDIWEINDRDNLTEGLWALHLIRDNW
jgi:hypothetical protein